MQPGSGPATGDGRVIRLDLSYEGTLYHGFGLQPGFLTVQEVVEGALAATLGETVRVIAAGRTDAGVHASGQVVSVRTDSRMASDVVVRAINARLPDDVLVHRAIYLPSPFDARRHAIRRHYRYTIWNRPEPSLWWRRHAWHLPGDLDVSEMSKATRLLVGKRDFGAFAGSDPRQSPTRTSVRTVERAAWRRAGGFIHFDITADSFLRHMVRGMVGSLVWVGNGRLSVEELAETLGSSDRRRAGPNAPAHGLMLVGVDYPDGLGGTSRLREMDGTLWTEN